MKLALRYRLDRKIRAAVMALMGRLTRRSPEQAVDLKSETIKKILLVRGIFRLGDSILATPAILLLRKNFPRARIDFVGPAISKSLFRNLPYDHHYEIHKSLPRVCWSYIALLRQIRAARYDLAVDVSGSSAALGSFIVGFSGARLRAGQRGKWDHWFNIRLARPAVKNKYRNLPAILAEMGLRTGKCFPSLRLSAKEMERGKKRLDAMQGKSDGPLVGIFVGGRKTRGKRWPKERFADLAARLHAAGTRSVIFIGPEERELVEYFKDALKLHSVVVFEPDSRSFASMVAHCDLFVACDSGPVHLACALRVRTVAIFLHNNFDRWGPPGDLGQILYRETGPSVDDVLETCLGELSDQPAERELREMVNG